MDANLLQPTVTMLSTGNIQNMTTIIWHQSAQVGTRS